MKLRKEVVHYLSKKIIEHLEEKEIIEYDCDFDSAVSIVESSIVNDLMVEDKLNEEVKEILREQENQIDENNINYRKVFQMVKNKLARERGLIL
ncbi:MAG: DUF507 family protein [Nitrospinota bacterium]|nr:DUF507 family protein [Nitrospinota bacterium]